MNFKVEGILGQINDNNDLALIQNLDKLHTTYLGTERIKRNLCLNVDDIVNWCRKRIQDPNSNILKRGKNWYIKIDDCEITVNASSYTIITAHRFKKNKV